MSKKKDTLDELASPKSQELLSEIRSLQRKVDDATMPTPKGSRRKKAGLVKDMQFDNAVVLNVYADYHRVLQDRLEITLGVPAAKDEFDPAEIKRRAAWGMVDEVSEAVADKWRNYTPTPGKWAGHTAATARQQVMADLRDGIMASLDGYQEMVIDNLISDYTEDGGAVGSLKARKAKGFMREGVQQGREIITEAFGQLEADLPGMHLPQVAGERPRALQDAWDITRRVVKRYVPETMDAPSTSGELAMVCYLTVAQRAVQEAFNLVAHGVKNPDREPAALPRCFAGSILTGLGLPQIMQEEAFTEEEEAAAEAEGRELVPLVVNGEAAETLPALQLRELAVVFDAVASSLVRGDLQADVQKMFETRARRLPEAAPQPATFVDLVEGYDKPRAAPVLSAQDDERAWRKAGDMIEDIAMSLKVEMRKRDGWQMSGPSPRSLAQKEDFVYAQQGNLQLRPVKTLH